ncbi:MAG: hypothetical protein R8J84_07455 [Mariprofundales bacterium]
MTLHILEPTLINDAGHCFTVASALIGAASMRQLPIHLWLGKEADSQLISASGVQLTPYFSRKLRRIQLHFLLRRLLADGETVFVPTASRSELLAYALIPRRLRQRGKVVFYVHQMGMDGRRFARLQWIARKAPEARILTTTEALADAIRRAGLRNVQRQACPFALPHEAPESTHFCQVIFPGMARMDKNLPLVAKLIACMQTTQSTIPLLLQAGPNHHGEYAPDVAALLSQIRQLDYPHLTMPSCAMHGEAYLEQFVGGICLQPYRVDQYANKISGITLDALARGCPVVVRQGIWPATMVAQFDAGVVVDSEDAAAWLRAIEMVIGDYARYQANCRQAYLYLQQEHDPSHLLATLQEMP